MEFLTWHYSIGINYYIKSWVSYFDYINHQFNLALLLKSLFSPWKRLIEVDKAPGFDFSRFFRVLTFNLISRCIGAVVRLILVGTGFLLMIIVFVGGLMGLMFWVTIPLFGMPVYQKYINQPQHFMERLMFAIKSSKDNALQVIFGTEPGVFLINHTGISAEEFIRNGDLKNLSFDKYNFTKFSELVNHLVKSKVWDKEFFRKKQLEGRDLVSASLWWDKKKQKETSLKRPDFSGPGVAADLLFGYTPTLSQYSVNMSQTQEFARHLIGRENVVLRMERVLTAGNSVVLVGDPGVGKKTVVYEFAHRALQGQFGPQMAYRKVLEFDYNAILSGVSDINQKKTKLKEVLTEGAYAGNIILMMRDIHRLTNAEVEGYDFTEVFEEHLEKKTLKLIAISTPDEYERFLVPNLRLRKYLEKIEVTPPSKEEAMEILLEAAAQWEREKPITIQVNTLRKLLDESDKYITETPFPEKALELLDAVVTYLDQNQKSMATLNDANAVLAEKTGISFAKLSEGQEKRLGDLEAIIHRRLIDQDAAINLIAKSLRARTVGVSEDQRPVGSFLFLGPTGVGKTETAKVLASVYYGSVDKILRFDMAEYSGSEGLERLIGSVGKNQPGRLTTAIKNNPASLLLLDEIEKATSQVFNLFLPLLDEGSMTDAFGKKINARHLFVIGTSNAGAQYIRDLVSAGEKGENLQKKVIDYVLREGYFSPEFINRFDGVIVYEPLGRPELVQIAKLMLADLQRNLKKKGIKFVILQETAERLADDGYDPAFGARPMRRIVDLTFGDLVGKALLKKEILEGDTISIVPGQNSKEYFVQKTSGQQ
jgi:ATP-dependent Clp protease ATP-binding subunit ClpC